MRACRRAQLRTRATAAPSAIWRWLTAEQHDPVQEATPFARQQILQRASTTTPGMRGSMALLWQYGHAHGTLVRTGTPRTPASHGRHRHGARDSQVVRRPQRIPPRRAGAAQAQRAPSCPGLVEAGTVPTVGAPAGGKVPTSLPCASAALPEHLTLRGTRPTDVED